MEPSNVSWRILSDKTIRLLRVYGVIFFISFHLYLISYVQSTFLGTFLGEANADRTVGILYTIGAALSLLCIVNLPRLLNKFGNYHLIVVFMLLEAISIAGLGFAESAWQAIFFFLLNQAIYPLIYISLDIFLESLAETENHTGGLRTGLLTLSNIALVCSPSIAALILGSNTPRYPLLFGISALVLIPVIAYVANHFATYRKEAVHHVHILSISHDFLTNKDLLSVFFANLVLKMFYALMVIYAPLYLHNSLNFNWADIGIMFSIMLIPFVIFELPVGYIADRWLGEKEMMITGFFILALTTTAFGMYGGHSLYVFAAILFLTRSGASIVEATTESYFFKKVNARDSDFISFFRLTNPLSYILMPLLAGIFLLYIPYASLFFYFGLVSLVGMTFAGMITDTK